MLVVEEERTPECSARVYKYLFLFSSSVRFVRCRSTIPVNRRRVETSGSTQNGKRLYPWSVWDWKDHRSCISHVPHSLCTTFFIIIYPFLTIFF